MMRSQRPKLRLWLKIIINAIAIGLLIVLSHRLNLPLLWQNILFWIRDLGAWGAIAFILIYNIATILFIPGSLLSIGGGALYGLELGSLYVFIASTIGATLAFLIGRYLARDWVSHKIRNHLTFRAIDAAVVKEGFKIVLLTRLSPLFPFNMLNYVFGITRVALKDYILGSVGMIPATVMYVYLGSLVGDIGTIGDMSQVHPNSQLQAIQWVIRLIGLLATIVVSFVIARTAKRILKQMI
ncbi:MAG: TVP38/TMEM64 family protein [Pseudanabaenaceae cyanobacterium bins.39]|nr:TVP38/TMEM64 family protein [Pseudanabaenaceae cyanobacterium bins.39]